MKLLISRYQTLLKHWRQVPEDDKEGLADRVLDGLGRGHLGEDLALELVLQDVRQLLRNLKGQHAWQQKQVRGYRE